MAHSLRSDADAILSRLKQEKVTAPYHITSVKNLPYICRAPALYSKRELMDRGMLSHIDTGGNDLSLSLDQRNDNWNKVSLNLTPYTPMAYNKKREQHLCFFLIVPDVAALSGTIFTDTNAASIAHRRGEGLEGLDCINFDVIRSISRIDREIWIKHIQAEVLVPNFVSFDYRVEVCFISKASMKHSELLCGSLQHPPFSLKPQLFTDSRLASQETIGFSYVRDFVLIDTNIDKNVLYLPHEQKNKFSKKINNYIVAVAVVRAMAGVRAKVMLRQIATSGRKDRIAGVSEFERSNQYKCEYQISLDELPVGVYSIEYYLNDLCWASSNFEVVQ